MPRGPCPAGSRSLRHVPTKPARPPRPRCANARRAGLPRRPDRYAAPLRHPRLPPPSGLHRPRRHLPLASPAVRRRTRRTAEAATRRNGSASMTGPKARRHRGEHRARSTLRRRDQSMGPRLAQQRSAPAITKTNSAERRATAFVRAVFDCRIALTRHDSNAAQASPRPLRRPDSFLSRRRTPAAFPCTRVTFFRTTLCPAFFLRVSMFLSERADMDCHPTVCLQVNPKASDSGGSRFWQAVVSFHPVQPVPPGHSLSLSCTGTLCLC